MIEINHTSGPDAKTLENAVGAAPLHLHNKVDDENMQLIAKLGVVCHAVP